MIEFVEFDRSFLKRSWDWLNDEEIRNLIDTSPITKIQQENWFASLPSLSDYYIWGIKCNKWPVGACGLKHVTSVDAEFFGYIGEKDFWGIGIGAKMLEFVEKKAIGMGLKRIVLKVQKDNVRAIHLYEKTGYMLAGEMKNSFIYNKLL